MPRPTPKTLLPLVALAALLAVVTFGALRADAEPAPLKKAVLANYAIDTGHSSVIFSIRHMGVGEFFGRFNIINGSFSIDPNELGSTSVEAEVEANSVDTANNGRDRHLKGGDFFDAGQFAKITFKSKKATKTGDTTFDLEGDFTMLGVKKSVTFKCEFTGKGQGRSGEIAGMIARTTIKRSDFKMNYGLANGALGDEVDLIISVEGAKS